MSSCIKKKSQKDQKKPFYRNKKPPNQQAFPYNGDFQLIPGPGDSHVGEAVDLLLCGSIASSPIRNTQAKSSPLALWTVVMVTLLAVVSRDRLAR